MKVAICLKEMTEVDRQGLVEVFVQKKYQADSYKGPSELTIYDNEKVAVYGRRMQLEIRRIARFWSANK